VERFATVVGQWLQKKDGQITKKEFAFVPCSQVKENTVIEYLLKNQTNT